jgi:PEP-CTERM motif
MSQRHFFSAFNCVPLAIAVAAAIVAPTGAGARQVLYVLNEGGNTIGEYNAVTGATINPALVNGQGMDGPAGLALGDGIFYVSNNINGTVGAYIAATGATINSAFVTSSQGVASPTGILVDNSNHLFVANTNTISEYNATTGATINPLFINGLQGTSLPAGLALDGSNHMFVTNFGNNTVGEYNATTGATINAAIVNGQGLDDPTWIVYDALGHLLVNNFGSGPANGSISEYDAVTGATINANLIGTVREPTGIALDNANHLFVSFGNTNTIAEYNATTGALIDPTFINGQGLDVPGAMVFSASVPEPGSLALVGVAAAVGWAIRRRRRRAELLAGSRQLRPAQVPAVGA